VLLTVQICLWNAQVLLTWFSHEKYLLTWSVVFSCPIQNYQWVSYKELLLLIWLKSGPIHASHPTLRNLDQVNTNEAQRYLLAHHVWLCRKIKTLSHRKCHLQFLGKLDLKGQSLCNFSMQEFVEDKQMSSNIPLLGCNVRIFIHTLHTTHALSPKG
jgi:hypothetical protein